MKVFVLLSVLVAIAYALPTIQIGPDPDIMNDLKFFDKCFDLEKIQDDIDDAKQNDPDIQRLLSEYLPSSEFKNQVEVLDKEPTYLAILTDLEKHGLPAYEIVNLILLSFGINPIPPPNHQLSELQANNKTEGFDKLFDKLMTHIDSDCTKEVFDQRQDIDPKFKALVEHLKSDEYQKLLDAFHASETVKQSLEIFNGNGLDLPKFVEYMKKGYNYDW